MTTNLILFDDPAIRVHLLPFTFTRPVAELRVGILTIAEKWATWLQTKPSYLTQPYLQTKFPHQTNAPEHLYINGSLCPTAALVEAVQTLAVGESLVAPDGQLLAVRSREPLRQPPQTDAWVARPFAEPITLISRIWHMLAENGAQIRVDLAKITEGRTSQPITDPFTHCYAPENIFLEPGAQVRASVLNAENGPIYLGKNAVVSEGSVVIGPFALGEDSTVQWGSRMRMNTTIGPFSKVGGEVGNSILIGYGAKQHDGYLGNSVIGEWCNLGANTNNSNLKNDYTNVKLHSYATDQLEDSGQMFAGLFMGDFTRAGISTMFNTGTVVGVNVNVYGGGFQPKYIPSFSWGGADTGFATYRFEKALQVAREAFVRRGREFDAVEEAILRTIFEQETRRYQSPEAQ
ncbi:putative sugar nucleotidyl transferase [Rudanella lutea]|uniref:putative sugar nucleotidyl transferase n=1 Tax=Rudanella lutea TaxID=451374 RepID=UPI00036F0D89|nr:putative sugar nucleotidyl transferase [Rudanella lutea]